MSKMKINPAILMKTKEQMESKTFDPTMLLKIKGLPEKTH